MAIKQYPLKAQYRILAGSFSADYIDGVYIDGGLFENNNRITDGVIRMAVIPQNPDAVDRWANFGFPTFQNGKVIRLGHKFWWPPGNGNAQNYDLRYNGAPYGIGLNTIAAELSLAPLPITRDVVFDVIYVFILEVE
jgi:hypothetical protein